METMCTLAACFHAIGKPEEGLPLLKEVFATRLETLGPSTPKNAPDDERSCWKLSHVWQHEGCDFHL